MLANLVAFKFAKSKHSFFKKHIMLILFFALAYYISSIIIESFIINNDHIINNNHNNNNNKSEFSSFVDCLYFSLVTQTTVGYGDIVPKHTITKLITMLQLLTIYGVILFEL